MKKGILCLLLLAALLLTGCNMATVDQLYCLPDRSAEFTNLQSVMQKTMTGYDFSAPLNGQHQQTVQMADLDGDGQAEYLVFAKGSSSETPLRIFIYTGDSEEYRLFDTIDCGGSAFDQVDYVPMIRGGGLELIVGRQVSDQVVRSLSVYTMKDGQMELKLTTNYSRFVCSDLSRDSLSELLVLRPGDTGAQNGVAELYRFRGGAMERSQEVHLSGSADKIKRIVQGNLNDGVPAVYVATEVEGEAIITDVFALPEGQLTNVSASGELGTSVQTLRNYYVYADDIDNDGVLELPSLISMKSAENLANTIDSRQYVVRWYALNSDGTPVDKMYTYHNFVGGWYLQLDSAIAPRFSVAQRGNGYEFSLWNEKFTESEKLMTLYVLTGQKREEQAVLDNRFIVRRSESTIYAMNLEVAASAYGITQESLITGFHLIVQDWNTGLT